MCHARIVEITVETCVTDNLKTRIISGACQTQMSQRSMFSPIHFIVVVSQPRLRFYIVRDVPVTRNVLRVRDETPSILHDITQSDSLLLFVFYSFPRLYSAKS